MSTTTRRSAIFAFTVVAAVLALSSAAFACTQWKGRMTVTAGGGSTSALGSGNQMTYCDPANPHTDTGGGAKVAALPTAGSITVTVGAEACLNGNAGNKQLTKGSYTVNYLPAPTEYVPLQQYVPSAPFNPQLFTDCMNGTAQQGGGGVLAATGSVTGGMGTPIGTINVDSSGNGSGSYSLAGVGAAAGPHDSSLICVAAVTEGMQVPFTFV